MSKITWYNRERRSVKVKVKVKVEVEKKACSVERVAWSVQGG